VKSDSNMIRSIFFGAICLVIFAFVGNASAQEFFLKGENIEEWHAIAASLISNGKYEESIVYYDKILEINPEDQRALLNNGSVLIELDRYQEAIKYYDRILEINPNNVKALASKGIALSHLQKYDEALIVLDKALSLEPDNKIIREKKANFLSGAMSVPAHNSIYDINLRVTVRDSSGNLVSISESTNTRYLPYSITEKVFVESFDDRDKIVSDGKIYEKVSRTDTFDPGDDAMGLFTIYRIAESYIIDVFEAFTPMVLLEKDDTIQAEWTIIKDIT